MLSYEEILLVDLSVSQYIYMDVLHSLWQLMKMNYIFLNALPIY